MLCLFCIGGKENAKRLAILINCVYNKKDKTQEKSECMSLYRKEFGEGIFYNHLQTDVFKTSSFSVNFVVPLQRETAAIYTVLPMILHRGCRLYPDRRAVSRRLEELYGTALSVRNYKRGELQVINFTVNMIDNAYLPAEEGADVFSEALSLLSNVLTDPVLEDGHFLQTYTDSEIKNCMDTIRAAINNKMRYAFDRCSELMFEGERYGIPADGYLEDYCVLTPKTLMPFYRHMLENARIELFYGGKQEPKDIEPIARRLFQNINRCCDGTLPYAELNVNVQAVRHFDESTPAEQGKLVIGFRTPITGIHEDAYAFSVFNEIYGGSAASKLFMNVREKKSLCYSCSSTGDLAKGVLFAYAGIENENKEITVAEITKQLDIMRQGNISDEELHCAKQSIISGYQSLSDSLSAMEVWHLRHILCDFRQEPEEVIKKIASITREDVVRVANGLVLDTIYFLKGDKSAFYNKADVEEEEDAD